MKINPNIDALQLMLTDLRTRNEPIRHKAAFKGSIPRRLVAKCCIDSLINKQSFNKIIEVTSSSENKRVSFKKAMQNI